MAFDDLVDRVRNRFDALPANQRERLIKLTMVTVVVCAIIGLYYATGQDEKKPPPAKEELKMIHLGDDRLEDDVRASVEKSREETANNLAAQKKTIDEQREEIDKQKAQMSAMQATLQALAGSPGLDLPDLPGTGSAPNDSAAWAPPGVPAASAGHGGTRSSGGSSAPPATTPEPQWVGGIGSVKVDPGTGKTDGSKKKKRRFYLSPGFMEARLLTGLKAKTVDSAKGNPEQMMLRIQAPAVLPNDVRAQLEGCLVVAHGYGDLSSERVETRLVSIHCIDYAGKSLIDSELHGIVVDSDAVKGLAGRPVAKWGTNLARLAFANAVQGAGAALGQASQTRSVSPLGQTSTIDPSDVSRAALGAGVEKGADEYARIIADLVRQQSPVVEVGPGKKVTVVVTEATWLEVKDYEEGHD